MNERSRLQLEQNYLQVPELKLTQEWKLTPLQQIGGIEVFDNLISGEKGMESVYKKIRNDILTPPFDQPTTIGIIGPSGVGKGSVGMGFWRLLKNDLYLHDKAEAQKVSLNLMVVPFALYQQASLLPECQKRFSLLRKNNIYTNGHYQGISKLAWKDIQEEVLENKDPTKKKILLIESASPTSFPQSTEVPVKVMGKDRGNSVLYNAALDERTRHRAFIFAVLGDPQVQKENQINRSLPPNEEDAISIFRQIHHVYTDRNGEEKDVSDLPDSEQKEVLFFLRKCMAPPQAIMQSALDLEKIKHEIGVKTDREYYKQINKILGGKNFNIVRNPYLLGDKTYDLDYLLKSLPARKYRQLNPLNSFLL